MASIQTRTSNEFDILWLYSVFRYVFCFDFIFIYNLRLYEVTRLTIEVQVRDNNVEAAIRVLKKKLLREGIFKELKLRKNYEKPSERKLREKAESIKRFKKLMRKKKYD